MDLNAEIAKYFYDQYAFSNEKAMAGALRSGRLQKQIEGMVQGAIVKVQRGGKFIYLTTEDSNVWKVFISEQCRPIVSG